MVTRKPTDNRIGIHIGNVPGSTETIADDIVRIMRAGFEIRASDETIQAALDVFKESSNVHATISNSTIYGGDKHDHYALETEPLDED